MPGQPGSYGRGMMGDERETVKVGGVWEAGCPGTMGRRESNTGSHRDSAKPVSVSEVEEETERERRKERQEEAQRKAEMQTGMYLLNSTFHIFSK